MEKVSTYVGLDVHKQDVVVALLRTGQDEVLEWKVLNDDRGIRRLVRKLAETAFGEVLCAYEAGPCGYALQRQLLGAGIGCQVIAPSLVPVKPGERIKTDRRDARKTPRRISCARVIV